jgi:hypothetical protein
MARRILPKSSPEEPAKNEVLPMKLEANQATTNQVTTSIFFIVGLAIWFGIPKFTNEVEAWDSVWYFLIMVPASFLAGVSNPKQWLWTGSAILLAQISAMVIQYWPNPRLLMGFFTFLFLSPPALLFTFLGSRLRWRLLYAR